MKIKRKLFSASKKLDDKNYHYRDIKYVDSEGNVRNLQITAKKRTGKVINITDTIIPSSVLINNPNLINKVHKDNELVKRGLFKPKTYSSLSDEEYNKRLEHNRKIFYDELAEKNILESKYKNRLPDCSKDIDIFEKEYNRNKKNTKISRSEKLKALKTALSDSSKSAKYYLKNKKIRRFDKPFINEAKLVTDEVPLKKRIIHAAKAISPKEIKNRYDCNIDGIKHDKAYKATQHLDPSLIHKETPIVKEYHKELDKITEKYKPIYKDFK